MRHFSSRNLASAVNLLAVGYFAASGFGNPTGKQPQQAMSAHGTIAEAKQLVPGLYAIYQEEEEFVLAAFQQRDNLIRVSDKRMAESAGRIWKARRDTEHLKLMAEPAAEDLHRKFFLLAIELDKLAVQYSGTPKGMQLVRRIRAKLTRERPRLLRFLQQADKALGEGKLDAFEKQMEAKGQELAKQLVFFSATARKPFNAEFSATLSKGDSLIRDQRQQAYKELASEAVKAELARANALTSEANRVRQEIAAAGSATLGENENGTAAEAFAYVANQWGNASASLMRATAIQWAFTNRSRAPIQPDHQQLQEAAIQALASIVDAAATSIEPQQAQATYSGLLNQIAIVERRCGLIRGNLTKACQAPLAKLAAKDPALTQRIDRYRKATSQVLQWRMEYAMQQAQNLRGSLPDAATRLSDKDSIPQSIRPPFVPKGPTKSVNAPTMFMAPANWMVHEAATRLGDNQVVVENVIRLSATVRSAVVPHQSGFYANVPMPLPSDIQIEDLQTALFVDPTHGPLTIEAADAISAAELHDYVAVGATIENVHLESLVTRFARLPDVAYALSPLGSAPQMASETEPKIQTCWRLDLKPVWAQHKYFTMRLKR